MLQFTCRQTIGPSSRPDALLRSGLLCARLLLGPLSDIMRTRSGGIAHVSKEMRRVVVDALVVDHARHHHPQTRVVMVVVVVAVVRW